MANREQDLSLLAEFECQASLLQVQIQLWDSGYVTAVIVYVVHESAAFAAIAVLE